MIAKFIQKATKIKNYGLANLCSYIKEGISKGRSLIFYS